ncbi:MAG: HypC/HybG/HupF family hydrogenase formation chaperone [Anaerolineae bacterium]|jgi:hydrogenase expression/formation protein HypC|nr:HypC/HybG/HupF family hydrogenase formation chaperone [Anaerolineae bacterium]
MCLAIPGQITELYEDGGLKMCKVNISGVTQSACVETVPDVQIGDYIIVHAGFALNKLSTEEAQETLDIFRQLAEFDAQMRAEQESVE